MSTAFAGPIVNKWYGGCPATMTRGARFVIRLHERKRYPMHKVYAPTLLKECGTDATLVFAPGMICDAVGWYFAPEIVS